MARKATTKKAEKATKANIEVVMEPWYAVSSSQVDDTVKIKVTKFATLEEATANRRTPKVIVKPNLLHETVLGMLPKV